MRRRRVREITSIEHEMLERAWQELYFRIQDFCVTKGALNLACKAKYNLKRFFSWWYETFSSISQYLF